MISISTDHTHKRENKMSSWAGWLSHRSVPWVTISKRDLYVCTFHFCVLLCCIPCVPGIFPFDSVLIIEFGSLSCGGSLGDYLSTTCYMCVGVISFSCIDWCIYVLRA